jgi:hypothetical protein
MQLQVYDFPCLVIFSPALQAKASDGKLKAVARAATIAITSFLITYPPVIEMK